MMRECWHECGRPAVVFAPDGRARCKPCAKDHNELVRAVLADMEARRARWAAK